MKYDIKYNGDAVVTDHADLLNKLVKMKEETLNGGWWSIITRAEDLIVEQEQSIRDREKAIHVRDRRQRFSGPYYKATYVGPLSYLRGKTAMLHDFTLAQFDDRGLYLAYGWHNFRKSDFQIETRAPLYVALATICDSRHNCRENDQPGRPWFAKWSDRATTLVKEYMPSGSGFDNGTKIDLDESGGSRLVFTTAFHHMDGETGVYTEWTEHQVIVTPSLSNGFEIRVTGRNKNDIKDYIAEVFHSALYQEVPKYGDQ